MSVMWRIYKRTATHVEDLLVFALEALNEQHGEAVRLERIRSAFTLSFTTWRAQLDLLQPLLYRHLRRVHQRSIPPLNNFLTLQVYS